MLMPTIITHLRMWKKITRVGVKDHYPDDRQKQIILSNRINVFVALIFLVVFIADVFVEDPTPEFGEISEIINLLVVLACVLHIVLNHLAHFRLSRVLMLIDVPFLVMYAQPILSWGSAGAYFWLPYLPLGFSVVPYLVYSFEKDNKLILLILSLYLVVAVSVDDVLRYFEPYESQISEMVDREQPFYKLISGLLFVFVNAAIYYSLQLSRNYEIRWSATQQELEKTNALLQQKNKELIDNNTTKDKFFRIIGHDLKGPIGQMIQLTQFLEEKYKDLSQDEIESFLNKMYAASSRGFKLVENLLTWARSQTGNISFNPTSIDMYSLVKEVMQLLEPNARDKNIDLERDVDIDLHIVGDRNMLYTILRNLISNSIKYTKNDGVVSVVAETDDKWVIISIQDNGVGMSQEKADSLFKIDSVDSTPGTADEQGTGIGLILCKEFVDKHQGEISVDSQRGEGSTFTVKLPQKSSQKHPEKYVEISAE